MATLHVHLRSSRYVLYYISEWNVLEVLFQSICLEHWRLENHSFIIRLEPTVVTVVTVLDVCVTLCVLLIFDFARPKKRQKDVHYNYHETNQKFTCN